MSQVEDFLTAAEEQQIIEAIRAAEQKTSGEIRVHIEQHTDKEVIERTMEVFHGLKMDNTSLRNGVLIYVAVEDHKFAIYGDKGIHDIVHQGFWDSTRDAIKSEFKKGNFTQGLINGIQMAGKELQQYFPWDHDNKNELSDEISKG
ncbi:TPM domain-containing protein [Aquimarina brevivitae]|uniref:TLP18.3/Psb32/MOLO-1 phosphatase superfamily protein n=1 Tax=Aquimarina brevivitae TaxID=323412 RepID=A0A4V2F7H7_9FLAO|nr:TPM domain-containing protein [Aquimarina brevivitae]RZS99859.1 TLP18.3/Psb32/MOLO-1 phosphatase superfamily protein [Aquimarina brevivitae]